MILDSDGSRLNGWDLPRDRGTVLSGIDSLAIGDIIPGGPLEIALAEQGGNNETIVVNHDRILWGVRRNNIPAILSCARERDPDKMAIGDFDPSRPGLEIFARSACGRFPWVHSSGGAIIATWDVPATAPSNWYLGGPPGTSREGGIDLVRAIDWNGGAKQLICLKERHLDGKIAIVDAMTGDFKRVFNTRATRSYVADVAGDYREEVIALEAGSSGKLKIYFNSTLNTRTKPRHWDKQYYRRVKQNWNYYSP